MARINLDLFVNKNEITKSEFNEFVKNNDLEVYTEQQVGEFLKSISSTLQKSEGDELNVEEVMPTLNLIKEEVSNLHKSVVVDLVDGNIMKSVVYWQENMIDIEKGVYKDNSLNRKLGRVGKLHTKEGIKE